MRSAPGSDVILYASDFPHETNAERAIHEIDELLERESELPDGCIQKSWPTTSRFYGAGARSGQTGANAAAVGAVRFIKIASNDQEQRRWQ